MNPDHLSTTRPSLIHFTLWNVLCLALHSLSIPMDSLAYLLRSSPVCLPFCFALSQQSPACLYSTSAVLCHHFVLAMRRCPCAPSPVDANLVKSSCSSVDYCVSTVIPGQTHTLQNTPGAP